MVNKEISIRRAVPADAQILSRLSSVTFSETFINTCSDEDLSGFIEDYYNEAQTLVELEDKTDFFYLAFIDKKPVGYLRMKEEESEVPDISAHRSLAINRLYVLKEYHSRKVGPALMNFALEFAQQKHFEVLWLGVWEHNERAKAFYKKYGFTDTGFSHPFPIGDTPQTDIWLMRFI